MTAAAALRTGWRAELELGFTRGATRTVLSHRRHTGPLIVQRPFYPEDGVCHVYTVHPPGGVVGGDELRLRCDVGPGAHALITTPAAGKFYRSLGATGRFEQLLRVDGGVLEWLPQENIFYPGTVSHVTTRIELTNGARVIACEVGCFGLPASGAAFTHGSVRQEFELWHDGRPLLLDHLNLGARTLAARWGMASLPVLGTLLAFPAAETDLALARGVLDAAAADSASATLVDGVLLCRGLGARADQLRAVLMQVWNALRPGLHGHAAMAPRIWST
jgi:urease accessory protein